MPTDPKQIWFPAKKFGWGWGWPCSWQGWVVMGVYFAAMMGGVFYFRPARSGFPYIAYVTVLTALFCLICWRKGEKPRWRWGGS